MTDKEVQLRLIQLDEEGIEALRKLCRAQHKAGAGGSAICACGAACGGTPACRALGILQREWELRIKPERMKAIETHNWR